MELQNLINDNLLSIIMTNTLSGHLLNEVRMQNVKKLLDADLILPLCGTIMKVIRDCHARGEVPSPSFLRAQPLSEFETNVVNVCTTQGPFSQAEFEGALENARKACDFERLLTDCAGAVELAKADPDKARTLLRQRLEENRSHHATDIALSFDFGECYKRQHQERSGQLFFVEKIDMAVGNVVNGKLAVIGGGVSSGKTTFAINIFYNNVVLQGYTGCFFSLEMSRDEIFMRLLVRHTLHKKFNLSRIDISWRDVKLGRLSKAQEAFLFEIVAPDLKVCKRLWIVDETMLRHSDYESIVQVLEEIERRTPGKLAFIVVDYLQLLGKCHANSRDEGFFATAQDARAFKHLANTFSNRGLAVFLLSQLTRAAVDNAQKTGGKYTLSAFAESAEIERASDMCLVVYSDEETKKIRELRMQLIKNRDGEALEEPFSAMFFPGLVYVGSDPPFPPVSGSDVIDELIGLGVL